MFNVQSKAEMIHFRVNFVADYNGIARLYNSNNQAIHWMTK